MTDFKVVGGLLNMDEASSFLGIKKSTLYSLVMRRQIKTIKIGKLNRFRREDLDKFITNNLKDAINERDISFG